MQKIREILKGAVVLLMIGLLFFSTTAVVADNKETSKMYDVEQIDSQQFIKNRGVLTRNHILPMLKGYFFIEDTQIKQVIKNIIFNLLLNGNASVDEIKDILDSHNMTVKEIYLLSEIKTYDYSDGHAHCFPGFFRALVGGFNAKGIYVNYNDYIDDNKYGWNLKINEENVTRDSGHFFGYYGYVRQCHDWDYPPIVYSNFKLDGYAILAFHGA